MKKLVYADYFETIDHLEEKIRRIIAKHYKQALRKHYLQIEERRI